jgi:putative endonuclease
MFWGGINLLISLLPFVTPALCGGLETQMNKQYYVYILTKGRNSTFYVGMTSNLAKRIWEHKNKVGDGFTKKYNIDLLVYYEVFDDPENAIKREKRLKKWNRAWKMKIIEEKNPNWDDLYEQICT